MNKKNTETLLKDFPKLYRQYYLPMTETCMNWGFDCGDGWFDLIYDLSQKLEIASPTTEATQVKQKYGGLRFYNNGTTEDGEKLVRDAEQKSYHTCEECGKKGKLINDLPWIQTLCKEHYEEKLNPEYLLKKRRLK